MAEKPGSDESPLELRQKIARSRELVLRDMGGLRYELNFPLKFRRAFQRNTLVWVGAALAVGLFLALLRARPQKIYVNAAGKKVHSPNKTLLESGLLLGALKLGLNLAQPFVAAYVKKKMAGNSPDSRPGRYR
jgi:integral membrane sensor domain MASE1